MAITTMFYKNIKYYKITRTWDYKNIEMQKYVRFGETVKQQRAALKEAHMIDKILCDQQTADRMLKVNNGEIYFQSSGKVVGINRVSSNLYKPPYSELHLFTVRFNPKRINKKSKNKIRMTCVSIHFHGLEMAYKIAVDRLIQYADISHNKPLVNLMRDSLQYYSYDPTLKSSQKHVNFSGKFDPNEKILDERLRINFNEVNKKISNISENLIEKNLLNEIEEYCRNNPVSNSLNIRC